MEQGFSVSARVREFCARSPQRVAWLEGLPTTVAELAERWQLTLGGRFAGEGEASWVAPVVRHDGTPAVLKLGMPHREAEHEAEGLRFWNGDPTVRLLAADAGLEALLLERCEPGTALSAAPEDEQDQVLARLLPRMWRRPPAGHPFRPLATMVEAWVAETLAESGGGAASPQVGAGIDEYRALLATGPPPVLLATDLHAGNVLRARREPWLVIDPKPFVGDPAYDATQHLLNCHARMSANPLGTIERYARLLKVDADRVRRWLFARLAVRVTPRVDRWREVVTVIASS